MKTELYVLQRTTKVSQQLTIRATSVHPSRILFWLIYPWNWLTVVYLVHLLYLLSVLEFNRLFT